VYLLDDNNLEVLSDNNFVGNENLQNVGKNQGLEKEKE
jgi:hypothetical protein